MNQAQQLFRISQLLSRFREQVKILNANGEFSINLHAENILIKVLNEIYGWNLENVNYVEGKNYPAIDLRDKTAGVAVQVTSTTSQEKQDATMRKFIDNGFDKGYDKLFLFIITDKPIKGNKKGIWEILDRTDLYRTLNENNNIDQIDRVMKLLEAQFADAAAMDKWHVYSKGLSSYDQYIHHLYSFLDIKGFSPKINNTLVKINLENIYVPLILKTEKEKMYEIEEALGEFSRLVILGDPGSGKSTILKHLAYIICSNREKKPPYRELVPVLIKGSEYAKFLSTSSKGLAEFIIDQLDRKYDHLFAEKLENDQLIVLIDGIDEINKIKLRHDVVNRINAFIAQYPNIKIIVSSRIVGYKEARLNAHFHQLEVGKFDADQIRKFAMNWYSAIAQHTEGDKDISTKAKALYSAISQNRSVYEMARSPLLLTIIALIHYQGNTLPEKRAALYEVATATFLENWVRQREVNKPSNFDKEMLIEMLSPISFHIHRSYTTGLILESELKILLLEEYRKINPRLTPKEEKSDVKDIIEFLREDTGFLFEKGRNDQGEAMFGFVHQTFQEYFAAIEFVAMWKEGAFKHNMDVFVFDANWREVITLAASIFRLNDNTRIGRQTATRFIRDLLYVEDLCRELSRPLIIAMNILGNDVEVEFSLIEEVIDAAFEIMIKDTEGLNEMDSLSVITPILIGLIKMEPFQDCLNERFMAAVKKKGTPPIIITMGILNLINQSHKSAIKSELIKILRSDNNTLKWELFDHGAIYPRAEIFKTKVFREEIVKYLNSAAFISGYNGKLPTQYRFGLTRHEWNKIRGKEGKDNLEVAQQVLSLQQLECEKMRMDLILHYVKDKGISKQVEITRYLSQVKETFPEIDVSSIEKMNERELLFDAYGLSKYSFIVFKEVKIYVVCHSKTKFGFVDPEKTVNILEYPFEKKDLMPYFKDDTTVMQRLFSIIMPTFNRSKKEILISDPKDFLLFIKYHSTMSLGGMGLNTDQVFGFGLNCVIEQGETAQAAMMNWLKSQSMFYRRIHKKFMGKRYKARLNASSLAPNDKLFILHLIGGKPDYEHLIVPTIEEFRGVNDVEEKARIKMLLYVVLER